MPENEGKIVLDSLARLCYASFGELEVYSLMSEIRRITKIPVSLHLTLGISLVSIISLAFYSGKLEQRVFALESFHNTNKSFQESTLILTERMAALQREIGELRVSIKELMNGDYRRSPIKR